MNLQATSSPLTSSHIRHNSTNFCKLFQYTAFQVNFTKIVQSKCDLVKSTFGYLNLLFYNTTYTELKIYATLFYVLWLLIVSKHFTFHYNHYHKVIFNYYKYMHISAHTKWFKLVMHLS